MRKLLLILFALTSSVTFSQTIEITSINISGIPVSIKVTDLSDSLTTYPITLVHDSGELQEIVLIAENGKADSSLALESGSFTIKAGDNTESIRVIPGWLSLVPPLIAILLALIFREVVIALFLGIFIGAIIIYDYNPVTAFFRLADTIIIESLADINHIFIITFTLLIGGVVGIITRNGGTRGLANKITKLAKTSRSGMISSAIMGVIIFFDDYANSLIIGNMMRPITDKLKISREKLAYIVDSTAAPIASVVLISTWIGYEIGLIQAGLNTISTNLNPYEVFINSLPYRFYPIAAIFFVFLVSFTRRDFGSMYKAEMKARERVKPRKEEVEMDGKSLDEVPKEKTRWINGAVPILIILFGTIAGLFITGISSLEMQGITEYGLQDIVSNSDSYLALLWSSLLACVTAVVLTISQKIRNINDTMDSWTKGVQSMMVACIILVFAWGISHITGELKTADYLISLLQGSINPRFLPVLVFIISAVISFSTGTSWGTMAIVLPIVIPLTYKISYAAGFDTALINHMIFSVESSVLAGSVFGDHCTPISDTTILSSMAAKCNHIDHVNTQLPYAIVVAVTCMLLGDILTAFAGVNPVISFLLIFGSLTGILYKFGKRVPDASFN